MLKKVITKEKFRVTTEETKRKSILDSVVKATSPTLPIGPKVLKIAKVLCAALRCVQGNL